MNGARDVPARSRPVPAGSAGESGDDPIGWGEWGRSDWLGKVGTIRLHSGLLRAGTSRAPFLALMPLETASSDSPYVVSYNDLKGRTLPWQPTTPATRLSKLRCSRLASH